jgi:pimeloyl-ACP methyl ester carboxylesterase
MNAALHSLESDIEPFRVRVPEAALRRLAVRLERERELGAAWDAAMQYGAPLDLVERLLDFWCDELDFCALADELPLFRSTLHGRSSCFVHARSASANALPLLWLHGYSGSVAEATQLLPSLVRDFHVVVPSLPGFGLSDALPEPGLRSVAESCAGLMARLGYQRYAVHGTELGAALAIELGRIDAPRVASLHVTSLASLPAADPFELALLSSHEKSQLASASHWRTLWLHATPESAAERLAWATCQLADSADSPRLGQRYAPLLWGLSLGLLGQQDFQRSLVDEAQAASASRSELPVCVCSFPLAAPILRRFAERDHRVVDWHEQPSGGELAALEQPEVLLASLRAWLAQLA